MRAMGRWGIVAKTLAAAINARGRLIRQAEMVGVRRWLFAACRGVITSGALQIPHKLLKLGRLARSCRGAAQERNNRRQSSRGCYQNLRNTPRLWKRLFEPCQQNVRRILRRSLHLVQIVFQDYIAHLNAEDSVSNGQKVTASPLLSEFARALGPRTISYKLRGAVSHTLAHQRTG